MHEFLLPQCAQKKEAKRYKQGVNLFIYLLRIKFYFRIIYSIQRLKMTKNQWKSLKMIESTEKS